MSVIAYDGRLIAADKQGSVSGFRATLTKLWRLEDGTILGGTGQQDQILVLVEWFKAGADPSKYPEFQKTKDEWSRLIVLKEGRLTFYEQFCVPIFFEDGFNAFGSGRDYAIGAMAAGCDARQAVHIASRYAEGCGNGVTWFDTLSGQMDGGES